MILKYALLTLLFIFQFNNAMEKSSLLSRCIKNILNTSKTHQQKWLQGYMNHTQQVVQKEQQILTKQKNQISDRDICIFFSMSNQ